MAATKKPRKPRGAAQKNQYSAELTSGQLVMGITILMVFGLACFLLGVLIGKVDPSIRPSTTIAAQPSAQSPVSHNTRSDDEPRKSAQQETVPEKTISAEPAPKDVKPAPTVPATAPIESADLPGSKPMEKPDPKPAPEPTPEPPAPVVEVKTIKAPKPTPKPDPAPATPASANKAGWYVQVGAFSMLSNAEKERKRIQSTFPQDIIVMKPAGSSLHKLLIGIYSSKTEAEKVRQQLLKTHKGIILHHEGSA